MTNRSKEDKNQLVFSYLTQRNLIGWCGIVLPLAISIFPARPTTYHGFEPSISDYYYTDRGDILVVVLSVLGVFLFTYNGYNWKEKALTSLAALCGLAVAFVPTRVKCDLCALSVHTGTGGVIGPYFSGEGWHLSFAATFLLCLAIMSVHYFPKTDAKSLRTPSGKLTQKAKRNRVYKICGWTMIASIAILGIYFLVKPSLPGIPVIFLFETIAVEAFGISWITKGETLWPD
jgi:hypothetical protein